MTVAAGLSLQEAFGAILHKDGVTFRVWAPFASAVNVAGTFNGWSPSAHAFARDGDGCWSVDVPGIAAGAEYRLLVRNGEAEFWRIDPQPRDVSSSVGDAIIVADDFDWGETTAYRTPSLNEMVIYEMHVGTFNDHPGGRQATYAA